jgi:glucose-1-phosphate thymidylyltransferase
LAEQFADRGPICLILGDTILQHSIAGACQRFRQHPEGAKLLLAEVADARSYGVAELDPAGRVVRITEKPADPKSNLAVIGVYFYDRHVFDVIRTLKPSARNELEITDVNNAYIAAGRLTAERIDGYWADAGESIDGYLRACNTVARDGANRERP